MPPALAIIGVGSNLEPRRHVPAALEALLQTHGMLHLSSVVETAPVGMTDGSGTFWNLAVAVPTDSRPGPLQAALHALERAAGRDREAPGQSWKARPLDLDLLMLLDDGAPQAAGLPDEPWIRPLVAELLNHLDISCPTSSAPPAGGITLRIAGQAVGPGPVSLTQDLP